MLVNVAQRPENWWKEPNIHRNLTEMEELGSFLIRNGHLNSSGRGFELEGVHAHPQPAEIGSVL